jgi:hypothetical protein
MVLPSGPWVRIGEAQKDDQGLLNRVKILADASGVYVYQVTNSIQRLAPGETLAKPLTTTRLGAYSVQLGPDAVYWISHWRGAKGDTTTSVVYKAPKGSDGVPQLVARRTTPWCPTCVQQDLALAVDRSGVYWTDEDPTAPYSERGFVRGMLFADQQVRTFASRLDGIGAIAVYDGTLYWNAAGKLMKLNRGATGLDPFWWTG